MPLVPSFKPRWPFRNSIPVPGNNPNCQRGPMRFFARTGGGQIVADSFDKPARYAKVKLLGGSSVSVIERMSDSRLLFDNLTVVRVPIAPQIRRRPQMGKD